MTKNRILNISVFALCFATIIGGAYDTYLHFDFSYSIDSKSYMKMAVGDYNVTVTHRYRVIVPLLAGSLGKFIDIIYPVIWKNRGGLDWSIRLAFFIINSFLISLTGLLIFKICQWHKASFTACIIAILAFLTSRWAFYIAGLPLIDSFYLLVIVSFIYGLLSNNQWLISFALLFGPLAKESFLLFLPVIFYFNFKQWIKTSLFCLLGLTLFFSIRAYIFSSHQFSSNLDSLQNAINHLENIQYSLNRILSFKGIGEIIFTFGFFNFLFFYKYLVNEEDKIPVSSVLYCMLPVIVIHIFLSGEVGRMLYLSAPYFCTTFALGSDMALKRINT